jgi:hypothetical protein
MHSMHDAQHRTEQPDERRGTADTGELGQAGFHSPCFLLHMNQ